MDPALAPDLRSESRGAGEHAEAAIRDPRLRPRLRVAEDRLPSAPAPVRAKKAPTAANAGSPPRGGHRRTRPRTVRPTGFAAAGLVVVIFAFGLIFFRGPSTLPNQSGAPAGERPPARAAAQAPRTFVWPEAKGAAGYEVKVFRGDALIFRARTAEPRYVLPEKQRLMPGVYRWYVWPVASGGGEPASPAIVQARLVIPDG